MHRAGRVIATMAVTLMAGIATVTSGTHERLGALATNNPAGSMRAAIASKPPTGITVLCFPDGGCIVCHNGYCEYQRPR
jgi:hypothetical protein